MNPLRLLFALSLLAATASAAFVFGDIYGNGLERLNKTVLSVDGEFTYQLVTDKGNYSIFLPDGDYNISASAFGADGALAYYAEEPIKVGSNDQRVDLVLKPVGDGYVVYIVGGLLVLGILLAFFYLSRKPVSMPVSESTEKAPEPRKTELDNDMKSVLAVLESHEGRATQKELGEELRFSDSKLSLILSELEESGHVKKFKRGRGNIIRKL